jgi:hypothetical protein
MKNTLDGFYYTFGHKNSNEQTVQIPASQLSSQPNKHYMQQALSFALNRVFDARVEFRNTGIVVHSSDKQQNFTTESLLNRLNEEQPESSSSSSQKLKVRKEVDEKNEETPEKVGRNEETITFDHEMHRTKHEIEDRPARETLKTAKEDLKRQREEKRANEEEKIQTRRSQMSAEIPTLIEPYMLEEPIVDVKNEETMQTSKSQTSSETPVVPQLLEVPISEDKMRTRGRSRTSIEPSVEKQVLEEPNEKLTEAKNDEEKPQTRRSRTSFNLSIEPPEEPKEKSVEEPKEETQLIAEISMPTEQAPRKRGRPKSLLTLEASNSEVVNPKPSTSSVESKLKRISDRVGRSSVSTQNSDSASSSLNLKPKQPESQNADQAADSKTPNNSTPIFEEPKPTKMSKLIAKESPVTSSKTEVNVTTPPKIRQQRDLNLKIAFKPMKKRWSLVSVGPSKVSLKKRGRPRTIVPGEAEGKVEDSRPEASDTSQVIRKRGRPPKDSFVSNEFSTTENNVQPVKRGRPPNEPVVSNEAIQAVSTNLQPTKRQPNEIAKLNEDSPQVRRGRPPNNPPDESNNKQENPVGIFAKRGRPPKDSSNELPYKKEDTPSNVPKRGRPPKDPFASVELSSKKEDSPQTSTKRGRPPKDPLASVLCMKEDSPPIITQLPRRGRPPKNPAESNELDNKQDDTQSTTSSNSQRRGRPPKLITTEDLAAKE